MFSGFWSWFLIVVAIVAVFNAHRLPEFKQSLEELSKDGLDAVKKGTKAAQDKIVQMKNKEKQNKNKDSE